MPERRESSRANRRRSPTVRMSSWVLEVERQAPICRDGAGEQREGAGRPETVRPAGGGGGSGGGHSVTALQGAAAP